MLLVNQKVIEEERLGRLRVIGRAVKAEGADSRDVARTLRFAEEVLQVSPSEHEDFLSGLAAVHLAGSLNIDDLADMHEALDLREDMIRRTLDKARGK